MKEQGFTLMELMVGVAIVGIMATFSSLVYKEYKFKAYSSVALAQGNDMKKSIEAVMADSVESNLFDEDRVFVVQPNGDKECESGCDDVDPETVFIAYQHDLGSFLRITIDPSGTYEIFSAHCLVQDVGEQNYLGWIVTDAEVSKASSYPSNTSISDCVQIMKSNS